MLPDAPVTFSTMTGWPSDAAMPWATMRASVSMAPPAETGTTMVMGWAGKVCAAALCSPAERAAAEAARRSNWRR